MKKHFTFSRNQKIGVAALSALIVAGVVLLNVNYNQYLPERTDVMYADFNLNSSVDLENVELTTDKADSQIDFFNPNKISKTDWENLGFSEKQANSIVKYRDSYGPFKSSNDVGKIYVISDEKFSEIAPFMIFDSNQQQANSSSFSSDFVPYEKEILQIEINSATKEELEQISGIGPAFSDRIVKYRNLIGGFYSSIQYSEIYGLKDESLQALVENTVIDTDRIAKIKINSCSKSELKKHPLFKKWEVVSAVLKERQKENLTSLDFLLDQDLIESSDLEKMNYYTSFE